MCAGSDAMDRTTANVSFSALLELAASNSLDDFKAAVDSDVTAVDIAGLWFCRKIGSNQMSLHHRTPLMIAAAYGSLDVLRFILGMSTSPIDSGCGPDRTTALHCAASGGAPKAADAVKILLSAGADPDSADSAGRRAADVVAGSPGSKILLHELLGGTDRLPIRALRISTSPSTTGSPPLSSSPVDGGSPSSDSTAPERKEYPVDPSLPDIKNSVYASDEFRIYSFKIRPCSRAYSHDWTECPFVHPGENARRRDPRKYNYSCVPCPDFRKGSCNRGDACEYAHGVFESWLHPAQYRTKLCKDGTSCNRRVCFFAHTNDELRTLYIPGGGVDSPRSVRALEMAMLSLLPVSPSAAAAGLSPVANVLSNPSMGWPQPSVPMLHLPSSNFQSSRLRSSLSARDMPPGDFSTMLEVDDVCFSPSHARPSPFSGINTKSLPSTNLDNLFSAEVSSPRYNSTDTMFSPSHKAALLNQLHQHQQTILSPINTRMYSPRSMEPQQQQQHVSMLQSSLGLASPGLASPGRMSPRCIEHLAITAQREKMQQQQQQLLRCLSDHNLGSGSPSSTKWGSSTGKLDWGVNGEELDRLKNAPFELDSGGVDVSWVQSMLSSPDKGGEVVMNACNGDPSIGDYRANLNSNGDPSTGDHRPNFSPHRPNFNPLPLIEGHPVLDSWLEQMQLDHA